MREKDDHPKEQDSVEQGRRDFLKGSGVVAGGLAATAVTGASTASAAEGQPENPYGSRPGGGISLPDYYKPWAAIKNRNFYAPGTETLPKNEMRISFLGAHPGHQQGRSQARPCWSSLATGHRSPGAFSSTSVTAA